MIDKKDLQQFDNVFPQASTVKSGTKEEVFALARKVSAALRSERDDLAKEQQENNIASGFFPSFK